MSRRIIITSFVAARTRWDLPRSTVQRCVRWTIGLRSVLRQCTLRQLAVAGPAPAMLVDVLQRPRPNAWKRSMSPRIASAGTSHFYAAITGFTQPGALRQLDRLTAEGLLHRGDDVGRNAHFAPEPGLMRRARAVEV